MPDEVTQSNRWRDADLPFQIIVNHFTLGYRGPDGFAAGKRFANLDAPPSLSLSAVKQHQTRLAGRLTTKVDLDLFHTEVRMAIVCRSALGANGRLASLLLKRPTLAHREGKIKDGPPPLVRSSLSSSSSPISSDQKLMGDKFPERRKKVLPSEGKNRPQLRGGTKRFIPCLYLCLAEEVIEGPSVRVKVQPQFG